MSTRRCRARVFIQRAGAGLDAGPAGDETWLNGRIGQVRVIDDDTKRPKLTLTSMKPLSSIPGAVGAMTDTNSLLPTKSDAGVDASR